MIQPVNTYRDEIVRTLDRIWTENRKMKPLRYFLRTADQWFSGEQLKAERAQVVVLGTKSIV